MKLPIPRGGDHIKPVGAQFSSGSDPSLTGFIEQCDKCLIGWDAEIQENRIKGRPCPVALEIMVYGNELPHTISEGGVCVIFELINIAIGSEGTKQLSLNFKKEGGAE